MPKPPPEFCIDSFVYRERLGEDRWSEPRYARPTTIRRCRIDRGDEYSTPAAGKQLLYSAIIFCYAGVTEPLPAFRAQSLAIFDGKEHTIVKVIPIYEPYRDVIYSYELEVV